MENDQAKPQLQPRGCKPKGNATSGVFTVRARPAELQFITQHARGVLGVSANQLFLDSVREKLPAKWIEQSGEGRPAICSKCGFVATNKPGAESAANHELRCWVVSAASNDANLDYLQPVAADESIESNQSTN